MWWLSDGFIISVMPDPAWSPGHASIRHPIVFPDSPVKPGNDSFYLLRLSVKRQWEKTAGRTMLSRRLSSIPIPIPIATPNLKRTSNRHYVYVRGRHRDRYRKAYVTRHKGSGILLSCDPKASVKVSTIMSRCCSGYRAQCGWGRNKNQILPAREALCNSRSSTPVLDTP